jgi:acetate kinase
MMNVLVLNAGSSSLKFQLIATDREHIQKGTDERICRGEVERIGGEAIVTVETEKSARQKFTASLADLSAALEYLIRWIASEQSGISQVQSAADIHAVGHRVVHGGERFAESAIITDEVLHGIEDCIDLAPLHNPNNVKCIQVARHIFGPNVPQVAVFDTAFHHSLPEKAYLYALPYHLYRRHHIRRYGFHGTSHRYVAYRYRVIRNLTREQTHVITLHLGNGCSAAAIRGGYPVDTSMGMTPLEGLMMGTRAGSIDPGIIFRLLRAGLTAATIEADLDRRSGLLAIGGTADMAELLEREVRGDRAAVLAIEMFIRRTAAGIAAATTHLASVDAVVFTGGIGEHAPSVIDRIRDRLHLVGKPGAETTEDGDRITRSADGPATLCIAAREDLVIADAVVAIVGGG